MRRRTPKGQLTDTARIGGLDNSFAAGASLDLARTGFHADAELGTIAPNFVVQGDGAFLAPRAIRSPTGRCG